jgi:hypothetical protein
MRKTITALSILCIVSIVAHAQHMQLRSHLPYSPVNLANIGGYVDSAGREYALVGATNGLSIVDVTNPTVFCRCLTFPELLHLAGGEDLAALCLCDKR